MANDMHEANQWFLRIAGGKVFGPVSTKGLQVWAEQGRVVPGNEVSADREHWIPAEQLDALEMLWYVHAGTRMEGPFNRVAAESFLQSNKAPSGARLVHRTEADPALLNRRVSEGITPEPPAPPAAPERKPDSAPAEPEPAPAPRTRRSADPERPARKPSDEPTLSLPEAPRASTALEEERDDLRRQLQELQAQLDNVRTNAEKDAQKRDRKLDALKQELNRMQEERELELGATRDERDQLLAAHAPLDRQLAVLTEQVDQLTRERDQLAGERQQLAAERDTLQQQLSHAMAAATDAANEAANGELRRRVEQLDAVVNGLRTELAQADQALTAERTNLAELLAGSNERDMTNRQRIQELEAALAAQPPPAIAPPPPPKLEEELTAARTRIAELQARLARPAEAPPVQTPDTTNWLRQFATEELTSLDKALHAERQSFHDFREVSTTRQEAIQARIQAVHQLLAGHTQEARRAGTGKLRGTALDSTRLQCELDAVRDAQQRETKQSEEREQELLRRIRVLENEEGRLRTLLEASCLKSDQRLELTETIRRREQELAQERRHHDQDREQFQSAQRALLRRIELLERSAGGTSITPASETPAPETAEQPSAAKPRRLASFGRWLQQ